MPLNFQFGYEWYLYVGTNGAAIPVRPEAVALQNNVGGGDIEVNTGIPTLTWTEYDQIRDVTFAASPTRIDVTTRKIARGGNTAQAIVSSQRNLTFQIRYRADENFTLTGNDDALFSLLSIAQASSAEVAFLILDNPNGTSGAKGFVGNFTISISQPQPLADLVVSDVEAAFSSVGDFIVHNGANYINIKDVNV